MVECVVRVVVLDAGGADVRPGGFYVATRGLALERCKYTPLLLLSLLSGFISHLVF